MIKIKNDDDVYSGFEDVSKFLGIDEHILRESVNLLVRCTHDFAHPCIDRNGLPHAGCLGEVVVSYISILVESSQARNFPGLQLKVNIYANYELSEEEQEYCKRENIDFWSECDSWYWIDLDSRDANELLPLDYDDVDHDTYKTGEDELVPLWDWVKENPSCDIAYDEIEA